MNNELILASASPRRRELLHHITSNFRCEVCSSPEITTATTPGDIVGELSAGKAQEILEKNQNALVLGCDTIVCVDGAILGKPKNRADAREMLKLLSGRAHEVYTGITLLSQNINYKEVCTTKVYFNELTDQEIEGYISTENVLDKAGAYAIQGLASKFIPRIEGDYFNVMGFPVSVIYGLLIKAGFLC